jgi:hypothetical protein
MAVVHLITQRNSNGSSSSTCWLAASELTEHATVHQVVVSIRVSASMPYMWLQDCMQQLLVTSSVDKVLRFFCNHTSQHKSWPYSPIASILQVQVVWPVRVQGQPPCSTVRNTITITYNSC